MTSTGGHGVRQDHGLEARWEWAHLLPKSLSEVWTSFSELVSSREVLILDACAGENNTSSNSEDQDFYRRYQLEAKQFSNATQEYLPKQPQRFRVHSHFAVHGNSIDSFQPHKSHLSIASGHAANLRDKAWLNYPAIFDDIRNVVPVRAEASLSVVRPEGVSAFGKAAQIVRAQAAAFARNRNSWITDAETKLWARRISPRNTLDVWQHQWPDVDASLLPSEVHITSYDSLSARLAKLFLATVAGFELPYFQVRRTLRMAASRQRHRRKRWKERRTFIVRSGRQILLMSSSKTCSISCPEVLYTRKEMVQVWLGTWSHRKDFSGVVPRSSRLTFRNSMITASLLTVPSIRAHSGGQHEEHNKAVTRRTRGGMATAEVACPSRRSG